MIYNIIDKRTRPYRWRKINAIVEATTQDNSVQDSDQQPASSDDLKFDSREGLSLSEAIEWAMHRECAVTLFIYDDGAGTSAPH